MMRLGTIRMILLIASSLVLGYYVFRDAQKRDRLLFDIPPWAWGLSVASTTFMGLALYWLANCARFVQAQTILPQEAEVSLKNTESEQAESTVPVEAAPSDPSTVR